MNKIALMGRLTRDPELRSTASGIQVASFTLAVDRDCVNKETGERGVDFIDCVAWRKTAEFAAKHVTKGQRIGVIGRLQTRTWEDQNGNKRKSSDVIVENLYFADARVIKSADQDGAPEENEYPEMTDDYPF